MEYEEMIEIVEAFNKKWQKKLDLLDLATKELALAMAGKINYGENNFFAVAMAREFKCSGCKVPSEFLRKHYGQLITAFIPANFIDDFYMRIDGLTRFPYIKGWNHNTLRTKEYDQWFPLVISILHSYKLLEMYGGSIEDYISNRMAPEMVEIKKRCRDVRDLEYLIAFSLDAGNKELETLISAAIAGEVKEVSISEDIIRGVVMSDNKRLHKLLADSLVDSVLPEKVRKIICDNADYGTIEAFQTIVKSIWNNDLIRFPYVCDAVDIWTGIEDVNYLDGSAKKVIDCIMAIIENGDEQIEAYTNSDEGIEILCGLWALGFNEEKDLWHKIEKYLSNGTENQILTMGYYISKLEYSQFINNISAKIILTYPKNYEFFAVFMNSFLRDATNLADKLADRHELYFGPCKKLQLSRLYTSGEEAHACFDIMHDILKGMPKKKIEFSSSVFPWCTVSIFKNQLILRMCITAFVLEDEKMLAECCDMLPLIDTSDYDINRSVLLKLLTYGRMHLPKFRETFLKALADRSSDTRGYAFIVAKEMHLTPSDYLFIERHLINKYDDMRQNVLILLNMQCEADRLASAERLINEKSPEMRIGGISILRSLTEEKGKEAFPVMAEKLKELVRSLLDREDLTEEEAAAIREIEGVEEPSEHREEQSHSLYDPQQIFFIEPPKSPVQKLTNILSVPKETKQLQKYFSTKKAILDKLFELLEKFYYEHGNLKYKSLIGEEAMLSNTFRMVQARDGENAEYKDKYPFPELWAEFYENYVQNPAFLTQMDLALKASLPCYTDVTLMEENAYLSCLEKVLGKTLPHYHAHFQHKGFEGIARKIIQIQKSIYPDPLLPEMGKNAVDILISDIKDDERWYTKKPGKVIFIYETSVTTLLDSAKVKTLLDSISYANDSEFRNYFLLNYRLDLCYKPNRLIAEKNTSHQLNINYNRLDVLDYIRAYVIGVIPENELYKAMFEYYEPNYTMSTLSRVVDNDIYYNEAERYTCYISDGKWDAESAFYKKAVEVYQKITDSRS